MRPSYRLLAETAAACPFTSSQSLKSSKVRPFSEIPGPKEIPIFGSVENIQFALQTDVSSIENYTSHLIKLHDKYGNVVKENLGFGRKHLLHLYDPADAQTVFGADGKTPFIVPLQETTQKYREMKGMNPGLGNLNGPEWYRLRSSVQHAMMRPQSVQTYLPFSKKVSDTLVHHCRQEQSEHGFVDMSKVAGRWSLESAGQILFEKSLGSMVENVEWADMLVALNKKIFQLSAKMRLGLPLFRFFTTPSWKKMVHMEDQFYAEVDHMMDDALDKLATSNIGSDMRFASYLINQKELNRKDIKVIIFSMFSDGLSTTAPMLIYNLFNIAKNKDAQNQIREEIKASEGENSPKLPFLRACIKETFRLFPIGTEVSRITQRDLVLGGFEVPAGTAVDINTNVLMRSSALFPEDPLVFNPSRWMDKSKSKNTHPFAFLPFGFGPRMCAGRRFAEQDLFEVLTKIVNNFEIEHVGEDITQIYETLLLPKGSCIFKFNSL